MINITSKKNCCGCSGCYNVCPTNCIDMIMDKEGFLYPEVDKNKCIDCSLCERVCPMLNEHIYNINPGVYACKNKDNDIKFKSSSGGVFSVFADYVLKNDGIVYGAGFNNKFEVAHMKVNNGIMLKKLRGAKYVQSNINDSFIKVKGYLHQNRQVLFSGTPCQIAGLNNYLNEGYNNLILVDVVCHGVPSPGVFKKYIDYMKKIYKGSIQDISFRAKELSIQALKIVFNNGKIYLKSASDDPYYRAFLSNLILRPSCYACKHNNFRSGSDITIADYWGASTRFANYNEKEGVSLVITKTEKGKELFSLLYDKFEVAESDLKHAVKYNPSITESFPTNPERNKFFQGYKKNKIPIIKLLTKYDEGRFIKRLLRKLKRIGIKSKAILGV